jgi:hypothetical protein
VCIFLLVGWGSAERTLAKRHRPCLKQAFCCRLAALAGVFVAAPLSRENRISAAAESPALNQPQSVIKSSRLFLAAQQKFASGRDHYLFQDQFYTKIK